MKQELPMQGTASNDVKAAVEPEETVAPEESQEQDETGDAGNENDESQTAEDGAADTEE